MVKLPFSSTAPPQWEPAEASPVACMIVFVSQCVWLCVFWVQRMDGSTTAFFFFHYAPSEIHRCPQHQLLQEQDPGQRSCIWGSGAPETDRIIW